MSGSNLSQALLITADLVLAKEITSNILKCRLECQHTRTGRAALELAKSTRFDVALIDLSMANESPLQILKWFRERDERIKLILLAPVHFRREIIAGLVAGADDFISKPILIDELCARIEAATLRPRVQSTPVLHGGPLTLDLSTRHVTRSGRAISLTQTEFRILEILTRNAGKVVTRQMLCEFLWNPNWEGVTNVIEVHMNRLRSKITKPDEPKLIHTVRGSGYCLNYDSVPGSPPVDASSESTDIPCPQHR